MNRLIGARRAGRVLATKFMPRVCAGGAGALLLNHSAQRVRFDSLPPAAEPQSRPLSSKPQLSPKLVQQISSGSLTGFGVGLVVALFSRTLVFFGGLLIASSYVATRYGLDLPRFLGLDKLLKKSSVWQKSARNPWFTITFALTFTLAAFVHL